MHRMLRIRNHVRTGKRQGIVHQLRFYPNCYASFWIHYGNLGWNGWTVISSPFTSTQDDSGTLTHSSLSWFRGSETTTRASAENSSSSGVTVAKIEYLCCGTDCEIDAHWNNVHQKVVLHCWYRESSAQDHSPHNLCKFFLPIRSFSQGQIWVLILGQKWVQDKTWVQNQWYPQSHNINGVLLGGQAPPVSLFSLIVK